jgi:hypothetical protein
MPDCHCADRENIDKKALGKEEESMCDITDVGLSRNQQQLASFLKEQNTVPNGFIYLVMADVAGMGHPFLSNACSHRRPLGPFFLSLSLVHTVTTATFGYCDKNSTPRVASLATAIQAFGFLYFHFKRCIHHCTKCGRHLRPRTAHTASDTATGRGAAVVLLFEIKTI